jgi:SOS-response transcriptional repressor LexA
MSSTATYLASYSLVQAELPGHGLLNLGVLLHDPQSDSLRLRLRRDMHLLAQVHLHEEEDLELLQALDGDLRRKAGEQGAEHLFQYLESTLSGTVRVTNREPILVEDFGQAVERLYRRHVESNVLPFQTHLPRYSLRAAAGKFLDNEEVVEEGWVETPENMPHLYPDMFVAEIVGHSMEPRIPDGSFCIFRANVGGSRSGHLVLAENLDDGAFAVKRYHSEKVANEGTWRHQRIHLESLNPSYPSWDLEPDEEKYRIIAEFDSVLY